MNAEAEQPPTEAAKPKPVRGIGGRGRFLHWLARLLLRIPYRFRVEGVEHLPASGGALLVCNHLSYADAAMLLAASPRPIRFLMYAGAYERWWIKLFASAMAAIPVASNQRPRDLIRALQTATDAIRAGDLVCIFAEGQVTRTGQMLPFRRGFERIMEGLDAPIVPVALDGLWGSLFSFDQRRFYWKVPRRFPFPVSIAFGAPMPASATPIEVRQRVQELVTDAWNHRREILRPLNLAFVRTARRFPFRFAMADGRTPKVSYGKALMGALFLARRLRPVWEGQDKVGILLPPSVPGALVNYAALLMGKAPVNLNYTSSPESIASCVQQCGLKQALTSKLFLAKLKLTLPVETVFIEELASKPKFAERALAFLIAWFCPDRWIERVLGSSRRTTPDSLATIIFSSGSTGDPKGVMLSHFNVMSNVRQLEQTFSLSPDDGFVGILPFFHSFGFAVTLCLTAVVGVGVVYHPSPLDASEIGKLVRAHRLTFLMATPTFLQLYLRSCAAEDFGSLRTVMTGAEKLPERLAAAFEEKFGVRPLEGYGCTECSPVVAVNTFDFRAAGFHQVGGKRGKIGHPLPGVSVRIVDAETRQPVPLGQSGLMLVRGPNVMQGYLGQPEKTAEVLVDMPGRAGSPLHAATQAVERRARFGAPYHSDKWYVTGDIAALDEDGFLQITDRLSRFSKIGGEMVPHIRVEERLHELAGVTEQVFVVTGIPDEKKGERLVVLHRFTEAKWTEFAAKLPQLDLPNLWRPRSDQFFFVDAMPMLGTGKLDLRKVRELAVQFSKGAAGS